MEKLTISFTSSGLRPRHGRYLTNCNFPLPYVGNPNIPVPELQGITRLDGPGSEGLDRRQTYTVTEVRGKKTN